ncbi:MAG: hypothetical protein EHM39_02375 [Chloroflexi bacterium]|nr:MAG: hypothetical protein EHM39_02375 [Chloroflexota bacterium]
MVDKTLLLAEPRLARITLTTLRGGDPPGSLWGCVVLPDLVRAVVGPTDERALDAWIERAKAHTSACLLNAICRMDGDALDRVLRYNPVWGGVHYQVWQAGSHRALFWSEYKLSNALYELRQAPVAAGWVQQPDEWPYTWVAGDEG